MEITIQGTLGRDRENNPMDCVTISVEGETQDTPEDIAAAYLQVVDKLSEEK